MLLGNRGLSPFRGWDFAINTGVCTSSPDCVLINLLVIITSESVSDGHDTDLVADYFTLKTEILNSVIFTSP